MCIVKSTEGTSSVRSFGSTMHIVDSKERTEDGTGACGAEKRLEGATFCTSKMPVKRAEMELLIKRSGFSY